MPKSKAIAAITSASSGFTATFFFGSYAVVDQPIYSPYSGMGKYVISEPAEGAGSTSISTPTYFVSSLRSRMEIPSSVSSAVKLTGILCRHSPFAHISATTEPLFTALPSSISYTALNSAPCSRVLAISKSPLSTGSVSKHIARTAQITTAIMTTHTTGFFHFARFRIRPRVSPSPKARGIPAIRRRPVARPRSDAE